MAMTRLLSLAHLSVLDAQPAELIELAAATGYDCVGLRLLPVTANETLSPIISDRSALRALRSRAADAGVGVLDIELFKIGPDIRVGDLEPALNAAAELGARHLLTQIHDENFERAAGQYAALCDRAREHGLTCDIEFLTWTPMRDLSTATQFLTKVDRGNGGVCIDALHFTRSRCRLDEIDHVPVKWLHYAQMCDAAFATVSTPEEMIRTAREDRLLPGEGVLDVVGIIAHLPGDIPLAVEAPNNWMGAELRRARLTRAREKLVRILDRMAPPAATNARQAREN